MFKIGQKVEVFGLRGDWFGIINGDIGKIIQTNQYNSYITNIKGTGWRGPQLYIPNRNLRLITISELDMQ